MRTRSQSRNIFPQQEASPVIVEPLRIEHPFLKDQFQEDPPVNPPEVPMVDNRTMEELLQAPTEGYEDAIVILEIAANNFELKHSLINLVQNKQFFGHDKEDPHAHIRYFNKITSTMRVLNVPSSSIKLMFFPFSLEGAARILLEKEAPRTILTWDDLVTKFINQFFPPSKTTNLCNEIMRFQQRFDESFYQAWDRFNDLLRACPHHGFFELHYTFYNALNINDQDSLNSAAGGNFLDKMPRECLKIIESKSKVRQSRAKAVVAKVSTSSSTPAISSEVFELKDLVRALLLDKKNQSSAPASSSTPAPVKVFKPNCVTCGGAHSYQNCPATSRNVYRDNIQDQGQGVQNQCQGLQTQIANLTDMLSKFVSSNTASSSGSWTLPSNTITNPKEDLKGITTQSGAAYQGPQIPTQRDNERCRDQANEQIEKFYEIFKEMSFEISFTDALILMPKFASTLKVLIGNKEKLSEMARTLMNEHCSTVILNKLPRKLGDPGKFLIPCEFPGMDECLALADLDASINLMPLFVWEGLSLPELTPTCMTLELVNRSVSKPIGIAKDVSVKVGVFHFPADFVVVDFEPDPRVPLILGSDNPTPYDDPIVSTTSPTLTPFGDSDFLHFEEADAFLQGDIILLEAILNSEPLPPLPNHKQYMPSYKKELKVCEAKTVKSSVDEPPEVELKDLPPYLEYPFLEGDNKLPVIISKELGDEEKSALIKVLKSHKRAIAWKLSDIQGGFTVVKNEENELIPTRLVTEWRVCIDYQKLNEATRKDHFPLPFMDQMLERLVGNEYYRFLDGFSGYFQIPIDPRDQKKTTFTCHMAHLPIDACLSVCAMHRAHFKGEGIVLGHKISKNGIEVDRAKVDVIEKLPHPTTVKGIRSFLGHAGFYRRFIQDFSKISRPMTHLLEKNTSFIFSKDCIKAFHTLKKKLMEAPILIAPNWDLPFELMCDASDFAIGAVLGQRHEKHFKPIHYANDAESNYTTTKKEMLAVVYAFEKFRSYLIMNKSIVHTDHSALKYLFAKKDAKARVLRWVLLL
nr:DNA-directed DNA polymerase [Tanacetum cinerariifolium]